MTDPSIPTSRNRGHIRAVTDPGALQSVLISPAGYGRLQEPSGNVSMVVRNRSSPNTVAPTIGRLAWANYYPGMAWFDQTAIDEVRLEIVQALGVTDDAVEVQQTAAQSSDWLHLLYQSYRDRIERHNDRVWSSTKTYLPIALAPFAALVLTTDAEVWHVLLLGFASTSILVLNSLKIRREQSFRDRAQIWAAAIEALFGVPVVDERENGGSFLSPGGNELRRYTIATVASVWVTVAVLIGTDVI
jgi:hypothetical protein